MSDIEQLYNQGIDVSSRSIYFGAGEDSGDFSWSTVESAIRALHYLSNKSDEPIYLHMNSLGGTSIDMMRLYDEIQACPCKIIFIGGGTISSSATWIMAGCDERRVHQHSEILIHNGYDGVYDRYTDMRIYVDHSHNVMDMLLEMYEKNSNMDKEFWDTLCQRDAYLSPEEAKILGIVDIIIKPAARGKYRKSRTAKMANMDKDKIKNTADVVLNRINSRHLLKK